MSVFNIEDGILKNYTGESLNVVIPEGVTAISSSAFSHCKNLQSVTIPDSVTPISESAFFGCSSLQSVTIPDAVTSISEYAFCRCSMQSVRIPDSVTSIGHHAFDGCSSLKILTIPNAVKTIGRSAFESCDSLQHVTIPDSVTSIGNRAFCWCDSLQHVTIPNSVKSIGDHAFEDFSLRSITIPKSVKRIPMIFGDTFPMDFVDKILEWYPRMTYDSFEAYVLKQKTWSALTTDTQAEIFIAKHSLLLSKAFLPLMTETLAEHIATRYLKKTAASLSEDDCEKIASFIIDFQTKIPDDSKQALHEALLAQKNGKKALDTIAKIRRLT